VASSNAPPASTMVHYHVLIPPEAATKPRPAADWCLIHASCPRLRHEKAWNSMKRVAFQRLLAPMAVRNPRDRQACRPPTRTMAQFHRRRYPGRELQLAWPWRWALTGGIWSLPDRDPGGVHPFQAYLQSGPPRTAVQHNVHGLGSFGCRPIDAIAAPTAHHPSAEGKRSRLVATAAGNPQDRREHRTWILKRAWRPAAWPCSKPSLKSRRQVERDTPRCDVSSRSLPTERNWSGARAWFQRFRFA